MALDYNSIALKKHEIKPGLKVACDLDNNVFIDCFDKSTVSWKRMDFGIKFISQFDEWTVFLRLNQGGNACLHYEGGGKCVVTSDSIGEKGNLYFDMFDKDDDLQM